jgi:hypothetical protein
MFCDGVFSFDRVICYTTDTKLLKSATHEEAAKMNRETF